MAYIDYIGTNCRFLHAIPKGWALKSGRYCFKENTLKNTDFSQTTLLQFAYGTIVRKKNQEINDADKEIYRKYTMVKPNDIILNGLNLNYDFVSQRIGMVKEAGIITSAYLSLRCNNALIPQYANYLLKAFDEQKIFHGMGSGVRLTLGYSEFSKILFPVPPREEQDQIVRYLDWKVSKINHLIHGYQRQIKLLEEKWQSIATHAVIRGIHSDVEYRPAGIMGFSEIPSHWDVLQNKRIFAEKSEYSMLGTETLLSVSKHFGVKPYAILEENEKFATIKPAESLVGYKKVSCGNLAMNIMRARNGSYGMSEYEGIVSPAYCVYETIIPVDARYMQFLLKTPQVISLFEAFSYGICEHRRRLYAPDFLRIYLPVPSKEEQTEIADYLEKEKVKIDFVVLKIQKQIALLKEYRTRLISDVVTGQIDVRNVVIPDYTPEEDDEDEAQSAEEQEREVCTDE